MLEKIEIGKTYLSRLGNNVTVLFIGKWRVLARFDDGPEASYCKNDIINEWSELPPPKKRYWLWDVSSRYGETFKSTAYMDEKGLNTNGSSCLYGDRLLKKHENEFIEV